jgi:hypothetical protein
VTLDEALNHVEERVIYQRHGDFADGPEYGVIHAVGERWVYVQYDGDLGTKATDPAHLTLAAEMPL